MILGNLPKKYKIRLPLCTSNLNDQREMLLYIPPAYHVIYCHHVMLYTSSISCYIPPPYHVIYLHHIMLYTSTIPCYIPPPYHVIYLHHIMLYTSTISRYIPPPYHVIYLHHIMLYTSTISCYIPPAYHVYFNKLSDSGSVINGHTAEVIQRVHAAYCCKRKMFRLYEQHYDEAKNLQISIFVTKFF
jgi:hypothetical protein